MSSLQVRLFFTYLVIIGVTLGLAALSLFLLLGGYRDSITYGTLEDLGRVINTQANQELRAQAGGGQPEGTDLLLALRAFLSGRADDALAGDTYIAVVDREGSLISGRSVGPQPLDGARITGFTPLPGPGEPAPRTPGHCTVELADGTELLCVSMPLSPEVIAAFPQTQAAGIIVAQPAASLGEVLGDLMPRLLFAGLIGVAAALVLGFLLSQSVAAPLHNISRAARSVARGNYRQRVPATGPREVRDLAATFNRMTEEVQRSQQTLRDFLANISHELKTPLTSIRGFSEAMLDGTIDDPDGLRRSAEIISGESNRLLRLVQELLDLSRIESGQISMQQEELELDELVQHVGEVFALRAEEAGVKLETSGAAATRIRGDFDRLEQVLNNLLDNAFRHTPPGGTVRIAVRAVRLGLIQVSVSDTGPGIPPEDVPHLFERFYRATTAGNGKGHGLGLAISREIVRAHGGEIWATSELNRGTTFAFTLPTIVPARSRAAKK
jgi:signal transduction histidine kinase